MTRIRCGRDNCINNKHGICQLLEIAVDDCDCYEEEKPDGELTARELEQLHKKEIGKLRTGNEIWMPSVSAGDGSNKTVEPVPDHMES